MARPLQSSVDEAELAKFSAIAAQWWDPAGKFAVLHKFNPVRLAYIREQATAWLGLDPVALPAVHRPAPARYRLRRRPPVANRWHGSAPRSSASIRPSGIFAPRRFMPPRASWQSTIGSRTAEELAAAGETFDIILNMEVVEHVRDPAVSWPTARDAQARAAS